MPLRASWPPVLLLSGRDAPARAALIRTIRADPGPQRICAQPPDAGSGAGPSAGPGAPLPRRTAPGAGRARVDAVLVDAGDAPPLAAPVPVAERRAGGGHAPVLRATLFDAADLLRDYASHGLSRPVARAPADMVLTARATGLRQRIERTDIALLTAPPDASPGLVASARRILRSLNPRARVVEPGASARLVPALVAAVAAATAMAATTGAEEEPDPRPVRPPRPSPPPAACPGSRP